MVMLCIYRRAIFKLENGKQKTKLLQCSVEFIFWQHPELNPIEKRDEANGRNKL